MTSLPNTYILTLCCRDTQGIVASVAGFLHDHQGFIVESAQFGDPSIQQFFMRTVFQTHETMTTIRKAFNPIAHRFSMQWQLHDPNQPTRMIIMASRQEHCLNDLLQRTENGRLPAKVVGIISNHSSAKKVASWYEIPFYHLPVSPENKAEQEQKIWNIFQKNDANLLVLARYMQILSPILVEKIYGQAINIHHSFLPSFKGAKPYHQAFERGVKIIGATAHYVSNDLDEGPIIEQEVVRVGHANTPDDLISLGQDIEAIVLARAIKYHAQHRVIINGNKTVVFH